MKPVVLLVAVVLLLGGCGGGDDETASTDTSTTTVPAETTALRVYFLRDGLVWPVARQVEETEAVATAALQELFVGPSSGEQQDLGLSTAVPEGVELRSLDIENGVAAVHLSDELTGAALAQVVYTLTQFPTVESVEIQEETYTRADFEEQTPAILVESPLSFEKVTSPLHVTGTANTFEATFNYELTDTDGRIVDKNFVTATSGTGTRGTFDFTTGPFTVPFDGVGELIVFELSAKDGSRIHLVEIPLRIAK